MTKQNISLSVPSLIVCALACEAKPLIDFYQLKKSAQKLPFALFQSQAITLVITGVGQSNMAAAMNWLAGFYALTSPALIINIGVAAHATAQRGSLFVAAKIQSENSNNAFYPTQWLKHKIALTALQTVQQPAEQLQANQLYDMEAYAFYQAALRYVPQEMIQCLKVVSDSGASAFNLDKATVSELIAQHVERIDDYIQQHLAALAPLQQVPEIESLYEHLTQQYHFTVSQSHQLKALLHALHSHAIAWDLTQFKNAKALLQGLNKQLLIQAVTI